MNTYKGGKDTSEILGVHQRTLYLWEKKGLINVIRTSGGKRLYDVDSYLKAHLPQKEKLNIVYVRVSSPSQKNDLMRQKEMMHNLYPEHLVIEDIGSGLHFRRKGIRKIIQLAINGKINEVVVAHKDRLTRFGFDLIEFLIEKYSGGKIIILDKKEINDPHEELMSDMFQLMNCFVARMNGLRKYKKENI